MELRVRKAVRKAVPQIVSISGTSGSGKTYSALLLAAGLAGPTGIVGLVDTENGRGEMYSDSPGIRKALPNGFQYLALSAPFSPERYIAAIDAMEAAGVTVCVIDSGSHEWEGPGGCSEIAEKDKGRWNRAKIANRRYVYRIVYSQMHIIVCLRAREKTKIIPKEKSPSKKEEIVSLGIQPIAEKNFVFEMLISLLLDEQTHFASPLKVPEPLAQLFQGTGLITKAAGERIREWNEAGAVADPLEQLQKRARAAAEDGMDGYTKFFQSLAPADKRKLADTTHEANKAIAAEADKAAAAQEEANTSNQSTNDDIPTYDDFPDPLAMFPDTLIRVKRKAYTNLAEAADRWTETQL